MSTFSINEAALTEIQHIFRQSKCRDPVARLYESADPGHLFDEFKTELLKKTQTAEDLGAMGRKRFEEVGDQLKSSLMVGACERTDFQPKDLCDVNGITLVMGFGVAEMLREYCLTFEDGRFLFRGADNVAHTLRSLAKKS
ncbi:MAG: hypothetical protein A3I66_12410 [Burkholderiales bacterium RIFCSPLOWO2_02_FULL_57_36]|nr:MAG: hypothetical protein A3I66_12410 [Burkholderiales bacterium RIFCSPLOWO2_02_FULL_57_36]